MSLLAYLKEKWLTYVFAAAGFAFAAAVYKLDTDLNITVSNAAYIMTGLGLLFIVFAVIDYTVMNWRLEKFKRFCDLIAPSDIIDEFFYPLDKGYAECVHTISQEYEKHKAEMHTRSSEDLEFVTKWTHDIKVPISALRLILESYESDLPQEFYQKMDTEISKIQQGTQTILYNIKSNTFYQDYRISRVRTKKLIADVLKEYSNFFSYKKINISITGEDHQVLTDEKWSSYIISQIISNAVKYTPDHGDISICTSRDEGKTTISIRNSGMGITRKDIEQVFEEGYTSSVDRIGMKATGYGMYLAKKLSDKLGHELLVESEPGQYAQFDISFFDENEAVYRVTKM
ncbi:sensor histidine kinase [hydrocarbon metagenome]|uniref:histidine kinase n=1 Tax=hydrocarbon metagenome TaxID=938273 RepID=A0A0W8E9Y1_9ZZZZ